MQNTITPEEKNRRKRIMESAIWCTKMDGEELTPYTISLFERFVEGEIELDDIRTEIDRKYRGQAYV